MAIENKTLARSPGHSYGLRYGHVIQTEPISVLPRDSKKEVISLDRSYKDMWPQTCEGAWPLPSEEAERAGPTPRQEL